jgi:inward rectifier potassium channel
MADNPKNSHNELELGFGQKNYRESVRFINPDGTVNARRSGLRGLQNLDLYHWLTSIRPAKFIALIIAWYLAINLVFGWIYYQIGPENFGGVDQSASEYQKFMTLFFFSSQTITTIGFGHIHPIGNMASIAAAVEGLLGLLSFAIATGLLFGRFSRPRAHIIYSKNALIAPYRGGTGLMFRITNKKQYELIECDASVTFTMNNPTTGKREFFNLALEISHINFLAFSWTIVHPIDEKSPIAGLTVRDLDERDAEILILMRAISDTFSQTVYSRYSYKADDIVEKARFKPLKQEVQPTGKLRISVMDIHHFEKLEDVEAVKQAL